MPDDSLQKCHRICGKTMFTKSHTDWIVNHNCFLGSTAEENVVLKMDLNNLFSALTAFSV